jgi:hypothetical protein
MCLRARRSHPVRARQARRTRRRHRRNGHAQRRRRHVLVRDLLDLERRERALRQAEHRPRRGRARSPARVRLSLRARCWRDLRVGSRDPRRRRMRWLGRSGVPHADDAHRLQRWAVLLGGERRRRHVVVRDLHRHPRPDAPARRRRVAARVSGVGIGDARRGGSRRRSVQRGMRRGYFVVHSISTSQRRVRWTTENRSVIESSEEAIFSAGRQRAATGMVGRPRFAGQRRSVFRTASQRAARSGRSGRAAGSSASQATSWSKGEARRAS